MKKETQSEAAPKKQIRRSRLGCHRCKRLKIKCTEERPTCANCQRINKECDYSIKLIWGGRPYKNKARRQNLPYVASAAPLETPSVLTFVSSGFDNPTATSQDNGSSKVKTEPTELLGENSGLHLPVSANLGLDSGLDAISHNNNRMLRNSEIFSSFINSQVLNPPPGESPAPHLSHSPLLADLYDNYSADIARIENSFPVEQKSNYITDFVNPAFWPKKPVKYTDDEISESNLSYVGTPTPAHNDPLNVSLTVVKSLDEENDISLTHSLANIPPSLTPLPELLMNVPYYRQLLHFWVNVAAPNLVPAPSHIYQDNPFKVLLPQLGMHYPGVLTTILAFAARARDTIDGVSRNEIIDQLLGRSCNELLKQLQDKDESTSDGTLATILLLSCYEVVNSNDFEKHRTHTTGASQIISARNVKQLAGGSPGSDKDSDSSVSGSSILPKMRDESDIAFFLMRWFTYVDVLGALSSTRGRENYLRAYRKKKYSPVEVIPTLDIHSTHSGNRKTDIDYLLGFDVRLLPHFINIALLIGEVEKLMASPGADRSMLPVEYITYALELKERFTQGYESGEEKRQKTIDLLIESKLKVKKLTSPRSARNIKELVQHDNILRATNKLYFDTGLLNLYRRVLLLPRSSPMVQDLADNMAEILEYGVAPGSPAEICTIFCHFCAGCETLDPLKRQFYFERFSQLAHDGNVNATKSLVIMNRCWETGEDWITAANALDIDLVLM